MADPTIERLDRIEAMLAELLRRYTPREAIPALQARLEAYANTPDNHERLAAWLRTASPEEPTP